MHRLVENHLEEALSQAGLPENHPAQEHLNICGECREEVDAMRQHTALLRDFAVPAEMEPQSGFYARVWERIESQRPVSIWSLFTESLMGRRLVTASLSLALLMGAYLVSTEPSMDARSASAMTEKLMPGGEVLASVNSNPNAVFMELVTYRGQ